MKLKNRTLGFLLSFTMVVSLTACGGTAQPDTLSDEGTTEAVTSDETAEVVAGSEELTENTSVDTEIEEILEQMSLQDKIEQMMFVSYRVWNEEKVTELNDEIRADLKAHHFGGTVLFADNFLDAEQTLRLVSEMQKVNLEGGGQPLIVAVDQEGGNVARIGFGTTGVGNMALAATGDSENARRMAAVYGKEMALLGINTDFAPVLDINNNPNNPVIGVRSFSDSPEVVTEFGLSFMAGLHDTGTIATVKHFPGHGNTDTDSHTGFPCIDSSYEELKQFELIPFQQAIDAGADMVMTAHIQYPQIETDTYTSISTGEEVYLPATMSRRILTDILRDDMGFEGVIVSDALDMGAITENFKAEDVLSMTINAGVNMLILPIIMDNTIYEQVQDMTKTAVKLAEEGKIDEERIDDSVRRILTLKKRYGLLELSDFTVTDDLLNNAEAGVGSAENREVAWDIANKALTLVKNEEDAFPIKLESEQTALILFADSCASRVATGDLAKQMLEADGMISDPDRITVMTNDAENEEQCLEEAEKADYCILVYRTYGAANLDPETDDGFSSAVFDKIITKRHEAGKASVVVTCQLPYDAARFPEADAILLAYNSATMRAIPPESGEGSAYAPNLAAALVACFGDGNTNGRLPVNLPSLDENYQLTDEILYERQN